jgi:CubicO group peptidase (beta-lactamase class C family)
MHLSSDTSGGRHVLSAASVAAMQERQADVLYLWDPSMTWGLGWLMFDWPGGRVIGHDGWTIGQRSFLRIVPARGVAVALLTNGGRLHPAWPAPTPKPRGARNVRPKREHRPH